jgi:hypothetical protein
MTESIIILLAGIFLPLFPMSMVFNAVIERIKHAWLRAVLLVVSPLCGLSIVLYSKVVIPTWVLPLALTTSALYALRMLSLREVNQWNGFLATSLWSLLWLATMQDTSEILLYSYALSMSAPLVLLVLLSAGLEQRFGAAYTELYSGLARTIPRYAGVLVTVVVAAIATPFAAMALLFIWLLWSWAGARLIQGLIVGRASDIKIVDMNITTISLFSLVLMALIVAGIYLSGVIL